MLENSDFYESKMDLFDNGDPEEFFLFISNLNMTLQASGTYAAAADIQYLCTLLSGESLRQFDILSAEVGINTSENLKSIIQGLGTYCFLSVRCQNKSVQCAAE